MAEFDPTADYGARRQFYQDLAKDPDFQALDAKDRLEVTRKVLFPGTTEKPSLTSKVADKAVELGESALKGVAKAAPFPGLIRAMTAPETIPKEQKTLPYLLNPLPEIVTEPFALGVEGIRRNVSPEAANLVEATTAMAPAMGPSLSAGLRGLRNLPRYGPQWRGERVGGFEDLRDVTPEAPRRITGPVSPTESLVAEAEIVEPRRIQPQGPSLMSPAQGSAGVFERQLAAEDALRQSPRGMDLLRAQLAQQEEIGRLAGTPEATVVAGPAVIPPIVIPPARAAAIAKGKARVKKPVTEVPSAETKPPQIEAPAIQAPPVTERPSLLNRPPPGGWTEADKVPEKHRKPTGLENLNNIQLDKMAVEGSRNERDLAARERERRRQGLSQPTSTQEITAKAEEAATSPTNALPEPTQAQIEAGNYKKGHVSWQGFDISIENPKGSVRSGVDKGGQPWAVTVPAHYGYLKRTEGADGDQLDIYLGDTPSDMVYVVDQVDADTKKFDEIKVIGNVETLLDAQDLYDAGFSDGRGPERRSNITPMTNVRFKEWVKSGDTKKPLAVTEPDISMTKTAEPATPLSHAVMLVKSGQGSDFVIRSLIDNYKIGPQKAANLDEQARQSLQPKIVTPQILPVAQQKEPWEMNGAKAILNTEDATEPTRDAAREAMAKAEEALGISRQSVVIDVPPEASGNPIIGEPVDVAPGSAQIGEEPANVPGQLLPRPSGVDVREPAGIGAGTTPTGEIEGAPGQQGAEGAPVGGAVEGQPRPAGGGGEGAGDIVGARPVRRPRGPGGRTPAADTGEGAGSDLPQAGGPGEGGEPQGAVAVQPGPSGVSLNHSLPTDVDWIPSGDRARTVANLEAIRLVKTLEAENRQATPEEKEILARWAGWGGLKPVFDIGKAYYRESPPAYYQDALRKEWDNWEKKWGKLYDQVKAALTREEWDAALESTANAHYTSREVINEMWKAIERLGFTGGNALEPAVGSGNFIGLTPDSLKSGTKWRAVELDNMTARVAAKLYPQARVENGPFEKSRVPPNSQDLVVSNVPFLSIDKTERLDKRYPHLGLHNYFFVRGLDLVKPGGLMVSITSTSTMDAPVSEVGRNLIADRADLVGAIRLPNTAFAESANTEVTTDILFFRKKDSRLFDGGQEFRRIADAKTYDDQPIRINEYFVNHPENVLGRLSLEGTQYGPKEFAVIPPAGERTPGEFLPRDLRTAIERLPENVFGATKTGPIEEESKEMAGFTDKPGRIIIRNGVVKKVMETGELENVAWSSDKRKVSQAKSYIAVRDAARSLVDLEMSKNATESDMAASRAALNQWYDDYVRRHGEFNSIGAKFLLEDGDFTFALSLEIPETKLVDTMRGGRRAIKRETVYHKSSLFTERVNFPDPTPERADTVADALQISMNFRGEVQPEYIAELTGADIEQVKVELEQSGLAFENPANGQWEPRSGYLSGNVKEKLDRAKGAAEDDPRYVKHVEELQKVQPPPVPIEKIGFKLGSKWLPADLIKEFIKDTLEIDATISITRETGTWHVQPDWRADRSEKNVTIYGAHKIPGHKMVELALNLKSPVVHTTEPAPELEAGFRVVKDKEGTLEAEWKQQQLQDEFKAYVLSKPQWGEQLEAIFNERFNTTVERVFDPPSWTYYPGASHDIVLRDHQKRVASRMIQESTGLFHSVGTGKTFIGATWAMELKRLRLANKTLLVVANATTEQFARQFRRLYPNARLLSPAESERDAKHRNALMGRIATEKWDAIILPQSFVNMIPDDLKRVTGYIEKQIDDLTAAMSEAAQKEGKNAPKVKDIRARIKSLRVRLEKLADRKTDDLFTFEQLGIDAIFVDESHAYKKNYFHTELENIKGLDTGFNQRGLSMMMKTRWIAEKRNGRNVAFATGTPVSNTIAEAWNIVRYLRPDLLEKSGIEQFDDFVGLFVTPRTALEMGSTGQFKMQTRLAKFSNQPALMQLWKSVADVVLTEDVALPNVPSIKGGKPQTVDVEKTPELSGYIAHLNAMLEHFNKMRGQEKRKNRHIPLVVFGLARKATMDMRMINPDLPDQPGSKLNRAVKEMLRIYKDSAPVKGTQMGFIDLYQNDPDDPKFNAYEEIKRKLIEGGIPEKEILIMTDKVKGAKREALFNKLNNGEIRVALGSRERMGVGVNAQEHIIAIHQIDVPHRPMDIEQSNGRGLRQRDNTEIPEIEILYYGVKGTLDAAMYDQLATKAKWIAQLLKGNLPGFDFNDPFDEATLSYDQQMALLSGNPGAVRKIFLENEIRQLEAMRTGHAREMRDAGSTLKFLQETTIPDLNKSIVKADQSALTLVPAFAEGVEYGADIIGKTVAGRKDMVATINDYFKRKIESTGQSIKAERSTGSLRTKPFAEMSINGVPIEMFLEIRSKLIEVQEGIFDKDKADAMTTAQWRKWVDKQLEAGTVEVAHDPESAVFNWRFADAGLPEFNHSGLGEGHATTGDGLLHSIKAAVERVDRRPADLRNSLQAKEKDVRNLSGFIQTPFAKEQQLKDLRIELQELLKTLGQKPIEPAVNAGAVTMIDAGEVTDLDPPSEGEVEIEMAIEDKAKVEGLTRGMDSAMESGDIERANKLRKQIDAIRNRQEQP